jgi:phosphoribosylanthranilate isomerase
MKRQVEVKICGLTNVEDARAALDVGADYLGFVLFPKSPRYITVSALAAILDKLPSTTRAVGVFVNEPPSVVERVAIECRLCAAQLHGDELSDEFLHLTVPVWRAVWFRNKAWTPAPAEWRADRYVVDAAVKGVYGGAGIAADWKRAAAFAKQHRVMLAGGLTPGNVVKAIRAVQPIGVDVVSGVESKPGKKDLKKVESFIRKAKSDE